MKMVYVQHAERTGKTLPEGWDTVNFAKPVVPRGAKGMKILSEEDPDYHPEPIDHLDPSTMGLKEIEKYISQFDKEVEEINKIRETGTAKDYTKAKMNRRSELENRIVEFEIEKENRMANMGESRRGEDIEEEEDPKGPPKGQGKPKSPWDQQKHKKETYPSVGSQRSRRLEHRRQLGRSY